MTPTADRRARWSGAVAALALGLAGLPAAAQQAEQAQRDVSFVGVDGAQIGTARLTATPHGLLIGLSLEGLPPNSWLGFHIHEGGECDPATQFESAGAHLTMAETDHGFHSEEGPHSGDMPNQRVAADGTLVAQVLNGFVFLVGADDTVTGRSLVLHAGEDDYTSQPAGGSGDRIACAVIE